MKSYFIGIDTGTQGVRIGIADEDGEMLTSHEKKWETSYPKVGWAEQNPMDWWESILEVLLMCSAEMTDEQKKSVKACCVCATSSTVLAIDEQGKPLMDAMMWMDARSREEMNEINETHDPVLDYCGQETSFEWMIPKALWIKRHRRDIYDKCFRLVEQLDWINYMLSGILSSSICNTTCKWNYIESKGGYQKEYFKRIGFEDYPEKIVTKVDKIGEAIGKLRPDLAERFGFNPDLEVVQGGIDAHMAMFGLNVIKPHKLGIVMGTSFVHLCMSEEKPNLKGIWGPYDSALVDGLWLLEGGQISAAGLVNWFRKNFHIGEEDGNPYARLLRAAEEIEPGSDGITVLDFFQGNRTPYKDAMAKGVIYGLNVKHTWKHIYHAVLESVSFGTHNIIQNYETQGYEVDSLTVCGGVTRDRGWIQMISDVTGKKIIINRNSQAGVLGCCVAAASKGRHYESFQAAADRMVVPEIVVEPDMEKHSLYQKPFQKYLKLYKCLKEMMHETEQD